RHQGRDPPCRRRRALSHRRRRARSSLVQDLLCRGRRNTVRRGAGVLRPAPRGRIRRRLAHRRRSAVIQKTPDRKAWLLVAPVLALVAFNALIPLMTVVNYSVQETFGDNVFFWEGVTWYEQVLHSSRFHEALM